MKLRILTGLVFAACLVPAADWVEIPAGGESMLPADSLSALALVGGGSRVSVETISVQGMPFSRALRVKTTGPFANAYDAQLIANTSDSVRVGDVVLLSMFARGASTAAETGEASVLAYLQRSSGDYAKVASLNVSASDGWKQYFAPVRIDTALGPNQHNFTIFLGYASQTIEIAAVSQVNYRNTRTVADLPRSKIFWAGSEPDAPWRAEAAASIERIRKADVQVTVVDASGRPVQGAEVRVRQKRHEFGFGSAVAADGLTIAGWHGDRYREVVRTWFNKVVLENDLKWPNWEGNRARAMGALDWLRDNGINNIRGHNLVWPSWRLMPADVQGLGLVNMRNRILNHIADEVSSTRGRLTEWDVVNEAYTNTDVQKVLGDAEMVEWFKKARASDPSPVLYINDYSILSGGGLDVGHQNGYFDIISKLKQGGAPLGGIGMQGHFGAQLTPTPKIWQILDRFSQFGTDIQITEFDIDIDDEAVQGAYTRDFMTAVFAHPSISGFMMWGFWEGRHWKPRAAMVRFDWSLKPNGEAFHDLVFRQWWTDVSGSTSSAGEFTTRAFKGEYDIEVNVAGQLKTVPATVNWKGAEVTVTLR